MRLTGKDREVNLGLLEDAHRAGEGDTDAIGRHYLAGLEELAGLGVGWAAQKLARFALTGAKAACRDYRRRSFLPGRTKKGDPIRVAAYSGAKRLENLTPAQAIAHAAKLTAQADTLNAEAAQIRRWATEAEEQGRRSIGRRAA